MQNRERLPIAFDFFKHGYYLTEKLADFPLLQISEGEIVALFVAQRAMAQYRGTPFEQPLRLACEKLMEGLKGEFSLAWSDLDTAISFRNIETNPVDIKIFSEILAEALIDSGNEVTMKTLHGAGHEDPQFRSPSNQRLILDFLTLHLKNDQ